MEIKLIEFNSPEYQQMIFLRTEELLKPVGVPASYINPDKESRDLFIGAFENGKILGCCVLTEKNKHKVQLRQMVVTKEWQGKGLGADIIRFAEDIAISKNFDLLMMHARDPVMDFYKKSGYKIVGEPFIEVGIGHHVMEKNLRGKT